MSRLLIKEIQVWSVARTVFPLAWIVSFIVIFGGCLLIGGLVASIAGQLTDIPAIDPGTGAIAGILFSLVLGFFSAVAATLLAVVAAAAYNLLAALGGGVSVGFSEPVPVPEPTQDKPGVENVEAP